jgi:hypothetical protein
VYHYPAGSKDPILHAEQQTATSEEQLQQPQQQQPLQQQQQLLQLNQQQQPQQGQVALPSTAPAPCDSPSPDTTTTSTPMPPPPPARLHLNCTHACYIQLSCRCRGIDVRISNGCCTGCPSANNQRQRAQQPASQQRHHWLGRSKSCPLTLQSSRTRSAHVHGALVMGWARRLSPWSQHGSCECRPDQDWPHGVHGAG